MQVGSGSEDSLRCTDRLNIMIGKHLIDGRWYLVHGLEILMLEVIELLDYLTLC